MLSSVTADIFTGTDTFLSGMFSRLFGREVFNNQKRSLSNEPLDLKHLLTFNFAASRVRTDEVGVHL